MEKATKFKRNPHKNRRRKKIPHEDSYNKMFYQRRYYRRIEPRDFGSVEGDLI